MSEQTQQAVSPVVAVILMVAVTVILSAVIGTFVLNIGQQTTGSSQSNIGVTTSHSNGNFTATVITGSADELKLLVNGSEVDNISNPSAGDRVSAAVSKQSTVTIVSVSDGERSVTISTTINGGSEGETISAPTEGMVSNWLLNGDVTDSDGSHDGTAYGNAAPFDDPVRGQVYKFDGSGDYIEVSDHSDLEPNSLTLSGWVQFNTTGTNHGIIGKYQSSSSNRSYALFVNTNNHASAILMNSSQNGPVLEGTTNLSTGTWYHLAVTYNHSSNKARLYLNGSVVDTASFQGPIESNNEPIRLADGDQGYWYLNGTLDDVRVYNRSLSSQEVSDLYESTK